MELSSLLTGENLEKAVRSINVGWAMLPGKGLVRVIETGGFASGFALVTKISIVAEQKQYDPEITLRRNEVEITLTTFAAGGVTESDIAMASAIDSALA